MTSSARTLREAVEDVLPLIHSLTKQLAGALHFDALEQWQSAERSLTAALALPDVEEPVRCPDCGDTGRCYSKEDGAAYNCKCHYE